jgi:adenylate cyclase
VIKKLHIILLFGLLCSFDNIKAQSNLADSLIKVLASSKENEQKVDVLNDLVWELKEDQPAPARRYSEAAIQLATRLNYQKGEAQAYNNRGVLENIHSNQNDAIGYFQKALQLRQQINDLKGVAALHNNIGNVYEDKRNYVDALGEYKKSLAIVEQLQDEKRVARVRYNIGLLHERMGNYYEAQVEILEYLKIVEKQNDKEGLAKAYTILGHLKSELGFWTEAETNYQRALNWRKDIGSEKEIADAMLNLGNSLDDLTKYKEALFLYQKALDIYQKGEYEENKANALNNIGVSYKNLGQYHLALQHLNEALAIREKLQDRRGIMETYNGLGDVKRRQNDGKVALTYATKYFEIAQEIKDDKFIQKAYKDLSLAYEMLGDYKKALAYRVKYEDLRYSRLNESRLKDFERREVVYGDFKKQLEIEQQERLLQEGKAQRNTLLSATLALVLISILLYNRYTAKNRTAKELAEKNDIIELERKRSDELLLNILPTKTAEELKTEGKAEAKFYENVTVLFTDFKSFTQIAEQLSARELVAELDICFKAFDDIVAKNGVEKIKTIGDAYMCVAGLPDENPAHAFAALHTALEMQTFMTNYNKQRKAQAKPLLEMRVGLHSGAVVAGVVGNKKFAYDIWGDTVNIAARMEAASEAGKVNISQTVYDFVQNDFICEPRGKISVKNKGEIEMYFVIQEKEPTFVQ